MSQRQIRAVVEGVSFPGYTFEVSPCFNDGCILRVVYEERDVDTGRPETQRGRMWIIPADATPMAIVQTCFKAILTSLEHRARENFTYHKRAVLQPHFTLGDIWSLAPERKHETEAIDFEEVA